MRHDQPRGNTVLHVQLGEGNLSCGKGIANLVTLPRGIGN